MNRFRSRKKAGGLDEGSSLKSVPGGRDAKKWNKKGKRPQHEPKLELDLSTALPTTADLRTSLLMPNLSARFSMLREQDDPHTKIGKASDDSVLHPSRRSRLIDFGYGSSRAGLTDIAEVASIASATRPPWLRGQHDSYASDDSYGAEVDSASGSIMARARPGEGNVLFGGRQKVYKISDTTSTKTLQTGPSMGKLVYDDDVSQSAFQKFQASERLAKEAAARRAAEEQEAAAASDYNAFSFGLPASSSGHSAPLPQAVFSHDTFRPNNPTNQRGASLDSSTTSDVAHDHMSTPATSIGSQQFSSPGNGTFSRRSPVPSQLERSLTKRKLYEQGLDQNMTEQQVSQLTRINSISRQRQLSSGSKSPALSQGPTKNATNVPDRSYSIFPSRPQSPEERPSTSYETSRPLATGVLPSSPQPQPSVFTAPGRFIDSLAQSLKSKVADKPDPMTQSAPDVRKQEFDEDLYLSRLQQLQKSQNSSPVIEKSWEQSVTRDEPIPQESIQQSRMSDDSSIDDQDHSNRESVDEMVPSQPSAFSVFQKAAAQMRSQTELSPQPSPQPSREPFSQNLDPHKTFFGDISPSDEEEDAYDFERRSFYNSRYRPGGLENIEEYPSSRQAGFAEIREEEEEEEYILPVQPLRTKSSKMSLADSANGHTDAHPLPSSVYGDSSPAVPSQSRADGPKHALGGLIHQHLRNTSNVSSSVASTSPTREHGRGHQRQTSDESSVYPSTLPRDDSNSTLPDNYSRFSQRAYNFENRNDAHHTHSYPWDLEDVGGRESSTVSTPNTSTLQRAETRETTQSKSSQDTAAPSWKPDHTRDVSEGTLLEREAFANELAARQRAIQENLKSMVATDSRGGSPTPSQHGAFKPFNMLRPKSSRESVAKPDLPPSKAMKMLGLGTHSASLSRKSSVINDDTRQSMDKMSPTGTNSGRWAADTHPSPPPAAKGAVRSDNAGEAQRNYGDVGSMASPRAGQASKSFEVARSASQPRLRSESSTSAGRLRQDRMYDDGAERRPSTAAASHHASPKFSPNFNNNMPTSFSPHYTPQQSPGMGQQSFADERRAHGSAKSTAPSPHSQNGGSGWTDLSERDAADSPTFRPGPPPAVPSHRTSPTQSPFHSNPTPPASGRTTPKPYHPANVPVAQMPATKHSNSLLRKKTVHKAEISEPKLISSTSNIDTVDLPPGASLKNGMEDTQPVPAFNPKRRGTLKKLFGSGRNDASSGASSDSLSDMARYPHPGAPPPLPSGANRVVSPDPYRHDSAEQAYRSTSAHGMRATMRSESSDDSSHRVAGPASAPLQRSAMAQDNMF